MSGSMSDSVRVPIRRGLWESPADTTLGLGSITLATRDDVQVSVRNGLTSRRSVIDPDRERLASIRFDAPHLRSREIPQIVELVLGQVEQPADVAPRHDQDVPWRGRVSVLEREHVVCLIENGPIWATASKAAERAGVEAISGHDRHCPS